jgi:hypothetical protein
MRGQQGAARGRQAVRRAEDDGMCERTRAREAERDEAPEATAAPEATEAEAVPEESDPGLGVLRLDDLWDLESGPACRADGTCD